VDTVHYRALIEARMTQNGYEVQRSDASGLLGYRRDFKLAWMATTLHLVVNVATTEHATAADLEQFTRATLEHVKAVKGSMRGFQSGVAAITVVVAESADGSAVQFARSQIVKGFAAFAWPVVVDLGAGVRTSHAGRPVIGGVYTSWMRRQIDALLPEPALVADPAGR
jgi:hypothetical protein